MIAWLKDFFGIQDLRRDPAHIHHSPCVVRSEDRIRHGISEREEYAETEDLNRIAKWQPGELKRMADVIISKVVDPVLLAEQEKHRIEKALEFNRGHAEGVTAERRRCMGYAIQANSIRKIPEGLYDDWSGASFFIADKIRSGE